MLSAITSNPLLRYFRYPIRLCAAVDHFERSRQCDAYVVGPFRAFEAAHAEPSS